MFISGPYRFFQLATIIPLTAISTGRKSPYPDDLQYIVRRTPLPAPIKSPVGPLMLSVHPGRGSFQIGITIEGRRITVGSSSKVSTTKASARDLV